MVNVKDVKLGKNTRKSFAKINEVLEMPNLIEVQKNSYQWFLDEGLVISGLGNDLLGWVIIISFELTGSEGKFQDDVFHWIIFACGLIHIAVSVLYSLLVWKKGTANGHALSGKILAVYDIIMTLVPYMYWFVVCVL